MYQHTSMQRPNTHFTSSVMLLLAITLFITANMNSAAALSQPAADSSKGSSSAAAAAPGQFLSIAEIPSCGSSGSRALMPELSSCSWSVQMRRGSVRWYAFEVPAEAAENMSVVFMARATSGQITLALWTPGSDPYRSPPSQTGINHLEHLQYHKQSAAGAGAGGGSTHRNIASEQQYLFLERKESPLQLGQYVLAVRADMGQPLVMIEVSTPSSMTQLTPDEQEALKELMRDCCQGLHTPSSSSSSSSSSSGTAPAAAAAGVASPWCSSVGQAVTYDLRQWYADICHVAPNFCDKDGHLRRLVIPPYALHCPRFPRSLARFERLQHLDLSYSLAPGGIADVAEVVGKLHQLQHLHLRGIGLRGPLSCELMQAGRRLQSLSLSDNDNLSGSLPPCWFESPSLEELQLAGLPGLQGPLPTLEGTRSDSASSGTPGDTESDTSPKRGLRVTPKFAALLDGYDIKFNIINHKHNNIDKRRSLADIDDEAITCVFGRLKYVNLAGVIGDAEQGLTGTLPQSLTSCKDILYLDLSGHALSGLLPSLPEQLQFLNLSSNAFVGSLPNFSSSPGLQYVDLSFNRLTGVIPEMTVLQTLDWLDLSDNSLTGGIPAIPSAIRWLDLSNNELTGPLDLGQKGLGPSNTDDAELLLVLLDLSHNKLTGAVPTTLAAAPHLSFLDLSHNHLSGPLDDFAAALRPTNQLLQINLSYNMLSGQLTHQLQLLAALRPVHATMRDGVTPVLRIFDISHNQLQGTFPTWLLTLLPQLVDICQCSVGINIDSSRFTCPEAVPEGVGGHRVMERLRRFEALQCVSGSGRAEQQIPIWHLAGSSYRHYTRQQHKALIAPQQQSGSSSGVIAGCVIAAVAGVVLLAAVVVIAVKYSKKRRHEKAVDALLHHFDPDHHPTDDPHSHLPAFTDCLHHQGDQQPSNNCYDSHMTIKGSGVPRPQINSTPGVDQHAPRSLASLFSWYSSSSSATAASGSRDSSGETAKDLAKDAHVGDGVCEIALVTK